MSGRVFGFWLLVFGFWFLGFVTSSSSATPLLIVRRLTLLPCSCLTTLNLSRVVGQPSSKTSYVVLGSDAGPKKLEAIKKHKLPTLDEDGFLALIADRTKKGGFLVF